MAIIKGTMTYTRFRVASPTAYTPEQIAERVNLFRFRALDPRADDNETLGFCPFDNEYDEERPIAVSDLYFDGSIVLAMRIDTVRLPKGLLRAMVKKSIIAYQREYKRLPDRTVKKEIELAESQGLRAKVLPKTSVVEAWWCQKSQELRIFSRATASLDRFIDLFSQTFVLKPERRDFPMEALSLCDEQQVSLASDFNHEPLYMPPRRLEVQ